MLVSRADLVSELRSQLQVASNSTLFPNSRLIELIKNAYIRATDLFIWNDLVKAKCTSTQANVEYYDYPEEFRSGTIMRLTVDGVPYSRKNFEDYLEYKYNNPNSTFKMFASFGRQYFIHPIPTSYGTNNIDIWGAIQAGELNADTTETIFSRNKQDCNMAVVQLALSVALKRIDNSISEKEEKLAIATLARYNELEQKATQRDQRIQHPKFKVPDYFAVNSGYSPIGGFNYDPNSEL